MKNKLIFSIIAAFLCALMSCSINTMAMDMVADMLTGDGGTNAFTSDNDPKLVGDSLPFAIKLYETLLASNPEHEGLLLTTGSLFIMYANAFVQGPAEMLPSNQYEEREAALTRSKQLYLRGYEILNRALELKYKGFSSATVSNGSMQSILSKVKKEDAGLLYWTVAGGLSAYSIDILDFELSAGIPEWTAMIDRAYELDPDFGGATLDEFYIVFYASLPEAMGGNPQLAEQHFKKAIEKTKGNSVGAYVSYAELICIPAEDYDGFSDSLEKAIAIDVDLDMSNRLVNVINQRKARWLLDNAWMHFYFLPIPGDDYF
ncbi:MAG: TRAP transporter TatT component family protein [Treponema sp.]|nr:TRAP transporter TatT component family protein [Treponema sp.]